MRVMHYYPRAAAGDGGPTLAVRGWARALAQAGCSVRMVFHGQGRSLREDPVEWVSVPSAGSGRLLRPHGLEPHIRWADLVVLHSAWVLHNVLAGAQARAAGRPYILTPHGGYDPNIFRRRPIAKATWWRLLERRLVLGAAALHLFFEREIQHVRRRGFRGRVIVAPNGIEVPPQPLWDGGSRRYVLWIGRYDVQHKGLDVLLEAMAQLAPEERPLLRLRGVDYRGGRAAVDRLARDLDVQAWVDVGGPVYGAEKLDHLRSARAFVYPSRWDAHSVAVLEAMALGVPCLITDTMAMSADLRPRGAAFVASLSARSLAASLREICGADASDTGRRGYAFCQESFSWDAAAARFLDQVTAMLGRAPVAS